VSVERYDAFSDLDPAVRPQPPGGERDLDVWRRRGRGEPHPLLRYGWRSELPIALGKDMADPERVATYEVRGRLRAAGADLRRWQAPAGAERAGGAPPLPCTAGMVVFEVCSRVCSSIKRAR